MLKVLCARSMTAAVTALAADFSKETGKDVDLSFGTVGALQGKLDAGETADVVILSIPAIDKLEKAGALMPGSRRDVAQTFIAQSDDMAELRAARAEGRDPHFTGS